MNATIFMPAQLTHREAAPCGIANCVHRLQAGYFDNYGTQGIDILARTAYLALAIVARSDAPYHNLEHTILVTLAGQEILRGKQILEGNVSRSDWLHLIISLLCHDIGYIKGCCDRDLPEQRLYVTGMDGAMLQLVPGATDASLTPFHVDRGQRFVEERLATEAEIDIEAIQHNIELTRFPVPNDEAHRDTANYPGLARAADFIGQLADPRYLSKLPAIFHEFEETGANKALGYRSPLDVRRSYPNFFWNVIFPYLSPALRYLEATDNGRKIIAHLYTNVLQAERESV